MTSKNETTDKQTSPMKAAMENAKSDSGKTNPMAAAKAVSKRSNSFSKKDLVIGEVPKRFKDAVDRFGKFHTHRHQRKVVELQTTASELITEFQKVMVEGDKEVVAGSLQYMMEQINVDKNEITIDKLSAVATQLVVTGGAKMESLSRYMALVMRFIFETAKNKKIPDIAEKAVTQVEPRGFGIKFPEMRAICKELATKL